MKTVWCEWDIGQEGLVFADGHVAERWLRNNKILHKMAQYNEIYFDEYYQMLVDDCLIGIEDVEFIQ